MVRHSPRVPVHRAGDHSPLFGSSVQLSMGRAWITRTIWPSKPSGSGESASSRSPGPAMPLGSMSWKPRTGCERDWRWDDAKTLLNGHHSTHSRMPEDPIIRRQGTERGHAGGADDRVLQTSALVYTVWRKIGDSGYAAEGRSMPSPQPRGKTACRARQAKGSDKCGAA